MSYVIKRPIITEKNNLLAEKGVYVFEAARGASKTAIKKHVESYFQVKADKVRTSICRNRSRRTKMGRSRVKYWKKAFVRLKPGQRISVFEGG